MIDRDQILSAIVDRGGTLNVQAAPSPLCETDLWRLFGERLGALGGRIVDVVDLRAARMFVEPAASKLVNLQTTVGSIWDAELGVSLADFAIAETGSLVLSAGAGKARLSSLAPPINLVIVHRKDIVATLKEAFDRIPARTSVMVTGPSRTADIEGVLVKGVHGPGELLVYVAEDS